MSIDPNSSAPSMKLRPAHPSLAAVLLWSALGGACASDGSGQPEVDPPSFQELSEPSPLPRGTGPRPRVETATGADQEALAIGAFLRSLDGMLRTWQQHKWQPASPQNAARLSSLEEALYHNTFLRLDELVLELGSPSVQNRRIAAAALGFADDTRAQEALLGSLLDDDRDVLFNALLSLGQLGMADTPTQEIAGLLRTHDDRGVRSNAAFALLRTVEAGADSEHVRIACRQGLVDTEPTTRIQCAGVLGHLADADAIDNLGALLFDTTPMVASAGARALRMTGNADPELKGRAARHLAEALDRVPGSYRHVLLYELQRLSGRNYGGDSDLWIEWAHRMP